MMARRNALIPVDSGPPPALPEPSLRLSVLAGFTVIAMFVGAFAGWSMFADLDSAVVAHGTIVVDSHRKTVQHLEGGILRKLNVREGDVVKAGQLLAELDSTQASANLGLATNQHFSIKARMARLSAERAGLRVISFPDEMMALSQDKVVAEAMLGQKQHFEARWRAHNGAIAILKKRISQLGNEIGAEKALLESAQAQGRLTEMELTNVGEIIYSTDRGAHGQAHLLRIQPMVSNLVSW